MIRPLVERAPCPPGDPLRVGVLVSGSGSNLQALLDAAERPGAPFRVSVVASNVPDAYALERARRAGVRTAVVPHKGKAREEFDRELVEALRPHGVELVVLAGFMRILTPVFLDAFAPRVVNVHPALCPAFPGMHAARQALEHGARVTGCTVHLVDRGVDTGPILAQAAVPIHDDDDEDSLVRRIQDQEHRLLPRVVEAIARGQVVVDEAGRVRCTGLSPTGTALSWS